MNIDLAKDRLITHSILNYLAASYQGWFAGLNLLSQLEHQAFSEADMTVVQQALSSINTWTAQLYQDECLFSASWQTAETFEAKHALDLLEKVKPVLLRDAAEVVRIMALQEFPLDPDVRLLLASLARHAYSRDAYVRGFIEYGERFGLAPMAEKYSELLPQTQEILGRLSELLRLYRSASLKAADLERSFFLLLHESCLNLAAVFRTHVHDINQLLSPFKGGFSFGAAEFSRAEAELWQDAGFGPAPAGYWRAYEIDPEEAKAWCAAKMTEVTLVIEWRRAGFTPETAPPWFAAGFPPGYAVVWSQAGFSPEKAQAQIQAGVLEPPIGAGPPG